MADRSLLESRIHDLENVAKKEKYDRTHAEGKLDALRSQLDALRSSMLASGAALPVDFAKSMDRIDLESDALGQIAAGSVFLPHLTCSWERRRNPFADSMFDTQLHRN